MRLTLPGYILLILLALLIIYLAFVARVFFLTLSLDGENRNSNSQNNITVSVPKEAQPGEEIEVIIYYYPRLFKKDVLKQIVFSDSTGAHSYKNSLSVAEELSFSPFYKSFTYKIPQQVCPEKIVYESCELVSAKIGKGTITLIHEPILSGGEGYQGDGEKIEVPLNIINN